jgi:hypothetical protein
MNYHIFYGTSLVKAIPGFIQLGTLEESTEKFSFKLPIFQKEFLYTLGQSLFDLCSDLLPSKLSEEEKEAEVVEETTRKKSVSLICGEFPLIIDKIDSTITMTLEDMKYTFINEFHVLNFLYCIPLVANQAAVTTDLFIPLMIFCRNLYITKHWSDILFNERQFALGSILLRKLLAENDSDEIKARILMFIEIHAEFISSMLRLHEV